MVKRFTKRLRQQIIADFCRRHDADFDARLFEEEVRKQGPDHPAYEWFQWDDDTAAVEYRIAQARMFASGLRVSFRIEEVGRSGTISVHMVDAPFVLSPMAGRRGGGGYFTTDLDNPEHMAEFCRQAATDLERWLKRYQAALMHVGGSVAVIERQLRFLEANKPFIPATPAQLPLFEGKP